MVNKYTMTFPYSEEELHDLYVNKGMSQKEIAVMFGVGQHKVCSDLKRMGIPARKAYKRNQFRENNSNWKGGKILVNYKTPHGYRYLSDRNPNKGYYIVRMPEHPNAWKTGYVFEHIAVALKAAGREKLDKETECVHHINFIRTDNRPENLVICTKDKHREYHGKLECLVGELLDKGIVAFDKNNGYYVKVQTANTGE